MENNPDHSNNINLAKPNSADTRNKVRSTLRRKFGKHLGILLMNQNNLYKFWYLILFIEEDVQGGTIPYKNWKEQTLYKVVNWPLNIEFKDYVNLNSNERVEVLELLDSIRFEFQ